MIRDHPIRRFYDRGLFVTVNSDDPKLFNTSLRAEFTSLMAQAGFLPSDVVQLTRNAIEAAWCSEETKMGVRKELDNYKIK